MIAEIVFAAGCFWGVEKHFENLTGVTDVKSGYVGGNYENPTYKKILKYRYLKDKNDKGIENFTEGVLVKFDTNKTDATTLIKSFWEIHDPTQKNGQGNDIGNNYASAIFYTNENQKNIANSTKKIYQKLLYKNNYGDITTKIKALKKFFVAEEYHQDYLAKNPNGYCPNHSTGVKFQKEDIKKVDVITPLKGKEIVVVEADFFCPYCEKFKKEISSKYKGSLPLRTTLEKNLKGFTISSKLDASPTILFIEDGKEIFSIKGYINPKEFYEILGRFKL